ncbi:hypothetical protein ABFT80_01155 [Mesorhizobium sp. SB112]|uniref:hypothetical protein n=1 Tax=Mesorhizobium sp. SB112 TaxID=3151853 RepID=UPI0032666E64
MMKLLPLSIAALFSCITVSGCTKTSDGSIVMQQPQLPSLMKRREASGPAYNAAQATFPTTPPSPTVAAPRRQPRTVPAVRVMRPAVSAPFRNDNDEEARKLACHNEVSSTGRIRVVCD